MSNNTNNYGRFPIHWYNSIKSYVYKQFINLILSILSIYLINIKFNGQ